MAEEGLIGALLLRPSVIAEVAGQVQPEDILAPRMANIYRAMLTVWERGASPTVETIADECAALGTLENIGGRGQFVSLQAAVGVPDPGRYVPAILEASLRRRVITRCRQAQETAADPTVSASDALDTARDLFATIDVPTDVPSEVVDVATFCDGEDTYDWLVPGLLERGDRLLVVAQEGGGKALDVATPVLTMRGWSTMGELVPGDRVFGPDGKPTSIQWCSPIQSGRPCYAVRFDDGSEIVADEDHLWRTVTYPDRQAGRWVHSVRTTRDLADSVKARNGHVVNHAIECAAPVQFPPDLSLPVDPYTLGAWLGDGASRCGAFSSADEGIIDRIRAGGWEVRRISGSYAWWIGRTTVPALREDTRAMSLAGRLRSLGLIQNKHIPERYLSTSPEQRLELLRGLLDTDGCVSDSRGVGRGQGAARIELTLTCERLARDAFRLILSLGIKPTIRESDAMLNGRKVGRRWRLNFQTDLDVFTLERKRERQFPLRTRRAKTRYVVSVTAVPSRPVRCISVDHPDSVFLAGPSLIPTHNSVLLRQMAVCCAIGVHPFSVGARPVDPVRVLLLDLENPTSLIRRKVRPILTKGRSVRPQLDPHMLGIVTRPGGIDVLQRTDARWLQAQIIAAKPDLVVAGPLYKMFSADEKKWEAGAARVTGILDDLRTRLGFALILETHAPHGFGAHRAMRPVGSSIWLRWPDFGLSFAPVDKHAGVVKVTMWKDRDERYWPKFLMRGGAWPWTPCRDPNGPGADLDPVDPMPEPDQGGIW